MAKDTAEKPAETEKKPGKQKLIIIAVVLLVVLGGVYKFVLAKPAEGAEEAHPEPVAGGVLPIDPVTINLADGAMLKFGMSLQLVEGADAHGEPDGSAALDTAIPLLTGEKVSTLSSKKNVEKIKEELLEGIMERYEDHETHESLVMDLFITNFVIQDPNGYTV